MCGSWDLELGEYCSYLVCLGGRVWVVDCYSLWVLAHTSAYQTLVVGYSS